MRETKMVVSKVVYGKQPIQKLTEQMIELLIHSQYTLSTPKHKQAIHSLSEPMDGDEL